jgi:acyl transferase domain-containing protein
MTATGQKRMTRFDGSEIAVVGLAGRFPGARSVDALWQNIRNGVESITSFSDDELLAAGVDRRWLERPDYVKAGAVLEGAEWFDAAFFGFSPRDAEMLDPQHRLFLETVWEALESAGYDPARTNASIGVFAGAGRNTYYDNLRSNGDGGIDAILANESDFLATRVAYKLDLKGPSLSIQTSCSTSLVAVHVACQQLLTQQCDIAVAGGVYLDRLPVTGYLWQPGSILSSDGHCRAFDARADGAVAGRGVGVVVLKRLDEALRDGDAIRAVIRGSAVNNDGATKVSYAAPSVAGQAEVIAEALAVAGVPADSIGLIEAHGTGTALGDPAEIAALTKAYRSQTDRRGYCAIGSIKSNIGHLDVAAGVVGLIKTVMALEHRELPPTLHFENANPDIDFERSPFFVNTTLRPWSADDAPRRAGVSSFGIGGTNAHVILEEAPPLSSRIASDAPQLLIVSARTASALSAAVKALSNHLRLNPDVELRDVAYTLQIGRRAFEHRAAAVCRTSAEAIAAFGGGPTGGVFTAESVQSASSVLVFSSAGEHAPALVQELLRTEPWFREAVAPCREIFSRLAVPDAVGAHPDASLFALELGLARRVEQMGLRPSALAGHGVGLLAAACIGGLVSLDDAIHLLMSSGVSHLPARMPRVPVHDDRTGRRIDARDLLNWAGEASGASGDQLASLVREDMCALIQVGYGRDAAIELRARSGSPELPVISMIEGIQAAGVGTRILEGLGRIWAVGCDLEWKPLHAGAPLMRVPLPSYPFERQRFWVEPRTFAPPAAKRSGKIEDLREWFHRPTWTQALPLATPNHASASDRAWLLFMDEHGVGADLAARLRARACRVVEVHRASTFASVNADTFHIDAASVADYRRVIDACALTSPVWSVVHLWACGETAGTDTHEDVDNALANGFYSVLSLAQALTDASNAEWRVHLVTTGALAVTGGEALRPARAALIGSCRVIPQELPHVSCSLIDVALHAGRAASRQIEMLVDELVVAPADHIVAHRGSTRWMQTFDPIRVEPEVATGRLRDRGVYLITGGTGGIGLTIAEYLVARVHARLVLVSRTGELSAPARARLGTDVLVASADVTNRADMERVVAAAVARFGRIDGVVHAAGVAGGGLIPLKTREAAEKVLRPKVHGTYVLDAVLRGHELDFFVLCSSLQVLVGGVGQIDYCAANAVLDAYAHAQWAAGNRSVVSIDWDAWQQVGMAVNTPVPEDMRREREESLQRAILPSEGTTVFGYVLGTELPQIAVYAQPFDAVVDAARGRRPVAPPASATHEGRQRHPRPTLASPYVAPRNRMERSVCEVFEDVLGLEAVGIHDSFFDLGGHSLLAMRLMKRVNDALQTQIPVAKLYEGLTVEFLVSIAAPIGDVDTADVGDADVAEKRREKARLQREHQQRRRVALGR